MVLESEAHPVCVEHRGCTGAIGVDDPAEAGDQIDVQVVREAARSCTSPTVSPMPPAKATTLTP